MLNMDDIGYMLFMSEQEKKESEKVNVKSFSSFGGRVNDHKRERENIIKTSHNRGRGVPLPKKLYKRTVNFQ